MKYRAVYAGSFDPITNGHLDIIRRAAPLVEELVVAVSNNVSKKHLFTVSERMGFIREVTTDIPTVVVDSFSTLLVDYLKQKKIYAIIRGLRAMTDFENEFQMALINKSLYPNSETVFLVTSTEYSFISSSTIKEVAFYGGDVSRYVPPVVQAALNEKSKSVIAGGGA